MLTSIVIFLNDLLKLFYNLKLTCIALFLVIFLFNLFNLFNLKPSRKVYLVDYACFKPKKSQQVGREEAIKRTINQERNFTEESIELLWKATMTSGIGDSTYAPEPLLQEPPDFSLQGAREEGEAAIFGAVEVLLAKTGVKAEDIGVLVVNCSVFNPVPSLSAMVVNRFKLRDEVKSFSVSGMGCSAGLAAIDLAYQVLQVHDNTYAMVVSTEVIAQNAYRGNNPRMLTINCVIRVGGAAVLLSNRPSDRATSKYQLIHTVRSNTASSDGSYNCIFQTEDAEGIVGVNITKDLLVAAKKTIKAHLITLGHLILPKSEHLKYGLNYLIRKLHRTKPRKPYTPDFRKAVDHFFPHVGGRSVIDEMERTLNLDMEAARMTLYRYGNTSSSSVWYELAYTEAQGRIKRGHRVWQVAFGSGFKCNSVIWKAMRSVPRGEKDNPWSEEIDNFPMELDFSEPFPFFFEQPE